MTTRALEDHEIKAIFDHINGTHTKRNETLLITGIGLALRASELVGLKIADVYDKQVKSYVTIRPETAKFGKERTIRIGDGIQRTISDYLDWKKDNNESLAKKAPLFLSQKGGHLTRQALFEIIKRIFRDAGVEQSPHCLRKTGATIYYIESDYDLIATQQFLGHADPSTTRRYIGLTSEQIAEYAERMSDHLFSAIFYGKFNILVHMSNLTIEGALKFLTTQGFEVSLKAKEQTVETTGKVIKYPMRRTG
jgi:integrase/recombinase XerD